MFDIINVVLPLFIIIALGATLRAIKVVDEKWIEVLNKYELFIGFPALILYNVMNVDAQQFIGWNIVFYNFALLFGIIGLTYLVTSLLKLEKSLRNSYVICIFFGNTAYLGIPIITSLVKDSGGSVAIHVAIYILVLFTLGIAILESTMKKRKGVLEIVKNVFRSPLFLSALIGILLFFLQIKPPEVIHKTLQLIANTSAPVALLALGMFIYRKIEFNKETMHSVILATLKLLIVPAVFVTIASIFSLTGKFNISIMEAAMPIAVTPFALSQIYPLNKNVLSLAILISTIFTIVTVPLLFTIIK